MKNTKKLFSGKLGKRPDPPVKIKLKKIIKLFQSPAYTVTRDFLELANDKIASLVEKDVLVKGR